MRTHRRNPSADRSARPPAAEAERPIVAATVTDLRESPRRPGRYTLQLSDGRLLLVGVQALADAGATRRGVLLDADAVGRLVRESAITDLSDRALGFLARGRRTRRELEIRLRRRDAEPALIAAALDRLEAAGILSDANVASAEASARLRRGEGPARVRQTLRRKGLSERVANDAVNEASEETGFDEYEACRAAAEKRARALRSLEPAVARRRLTAFLVRRGFGSQCVRRAVSEALGGR